MHVCWRAAWRVRSAQSVVPTVRSAVIIATAYTSYYNSSSSSINVIIKIVSGNKEAVYFFLLTALFACCLFCVCVLFFLFFAFIWSAAVRRAETFFIVRAGTPGTTAQELRVGVSCEAWKPEI